MPLGNVPFAPWLLTRPAEHAQASESGLNSGLQAAHIWAQAAAERQRIQEAQKRSDMENAMAQERLQQKSIYDAQKLATDAAYNKASLSMAQAKIEQTQANAARMAKQWEMQQQANQQRQALLEQARNTRLAQGQQRIDISKQNEEDMARHRLAMENKKKGLSEDEALAAYAKTAGQPKPSGPGILSRVGKGISDFFTGDSGAPPPPKVGDSPHAEGTYLKSKSDGKTYVIRGGLPVLVDSEESKDETPADEENASDSSE